MDAKRVSLKTIAREVGVSKPVVYTVLNNRIGKGIYVSEENKRRILKVAKEKGYVAPKSAKTLFTGKSDTIGIIFHKLTPFFSQLVTELQKAAFKRQLEIIPYITDGNPDLEEHYLNQCRDGRVDGVIVVAQTDRGIEHYRKFSSPPYNLKILAYSTPIKEVPTVYFDEHQTGILAYTHLKEIGCKKPGVLGGWNKGIREVRCASFVNAAVEDGYQPVTYKNVNNINPVELAKKFFDEVQSLPDGVFCYDDTVAINFLSECHRRGLKIPQDMAIVSCDNTTLCLYTNPRLTSIDSKTPLTAEKTIAKIEEMIAGKNVKPLHTKIPVELIKRESTERNVDEGGYDERKGKKRR